MENIKEFYSTESKNSPNEIQSLSLESLNKSTIDRFENQISPINSKIFNTPTYDITNINLLKSIHNSRPLGFDAQLNEWIESKKNNPIFSNSSIVSKEQLEFDKLRLYEIQIEISDRVFTALNNIPDQILCKLPGYDVEIHHRLTVLLQNVKAKIRQIDRTLLCLDQVQIKERIKNEAVIEFSDDIRSTCSKQSIGNDEFINNTENKDQSFDYVINPLAQKKYFQNHKRTINVNNNEDSANNFFEPLRYSSTVSDIPTFTQFQKNTNFQTRRPQIVAEPEKSVNTNYSEMKVWINEINSQIRTLPTSTITSTPSTHYEKKLDKFQSVNYSSENKLQNSLNNEDIIKINTNDLYSTSITWNDSEEDNESINNFKEEIKNGKFANEYLDNEIEKKLDTDFEEYKYNYDKSVKFIGDVKNDGESGRFNNLDFPHCRDMINVFRMKFGLHQFRPNQLAAINAVIVGHDCFILMPTGGGKSLCYQLPALLTHGITIVISPLRSLIIDQTQKLSSLDIPAMHLTADLSEEQVCRVYRKIYEATPDLKLLYVTPEKLSLSAKFCSSLTALHRRKMLARFVIDEVHCVSQWGHDFRPDYKKLSMLKKNFPDVPLIVLTATATPRVRSDILHQLHLNSPMWFISSFNRPNLRYTVIPKKTKSACQQIIDIIKSKFVNECGIVYCISRKDCDNHAKALFSQGINALSYHAGIDDKLRIERQIQWIAEKVKVICATVAFGMGIDKPNVRFVIHAAMPKSIEGYYQESGRAGRDGDNADCILLYNYADMHRYRNMMERNDYGNVEALKTHLDNLYKIVYFCENMADCRRALQLNYFGEKFDRQECIANSETTCDNCLTYSHFVKMDVTEHAKALVQLIQSVDKIRKNNVTILQVVDIYKGSNISNISYKLGYNYQTWFGRGQSMTKHEIERLLHNLVIEGYLCENMELNNGIVCAYVAPGRLANELLYQNNVQIFLQKKKVPERIPVKNSLMQMSEVTNVVIKDLEQRCYNDLFDIVNGIAGALDVSANSIMNIAALRAMSQQLPCDEAAMLKIPHVTKANFVKYGKALLDITQKYSKEKQDLLQEEQQTLFEVMDYDYDDIESEIEWTNHRNQSRGTVNKRTQNKTGGQPKKMKNNSNCYECNGVPQSREGNNYMSIFKNIKRNNSSKNSRCNKSSNVARGAKTFIATKGNTSRGNLSRGRKPSAGRGRGTQPAYNNGPGLCEFTKKYPIPNPL